MKYTLEDLEILRKIRLSGFDIDGPVDDYHTSDFAMFEIETANFLTWIQKIERAGKVKHLITSYRINQMRETFTKSREAGEKLRKVSIEAQFSLEETNKILNRLDQNG